MHIAILTNPRSGRSKAKAASHRLSAELKSRGHRIFLHDVYDPADQLTNPAHTFDRLVVVGGDGTMHHLLTTLCQLQVPVYHLATGTANLIAKHFRMSNKPKVVADNLERDHPPRIIDVPTANGTKFLMMLSLGIDASVIHRFENQRASGGGKVSGGYRAYTSPVITELIHPRPARVSIEDAAGQVHTMATLGIAVVANMPSYAMGVNPCSNADPSDAQLDARFVYTRTSLGCALKLGLIRLRQRPKQADAFRSSRMIIRALDAPCPIQIDGERPTHIKDLTQGCLVPGTPLIIGIGLHTLPIHTSA